jgi:RimJ/RimL family protein N-acetyltransferase
VQGVYRGTSQHAFCFVIEADGIPIGECWLQAMNQPRVSDRLPGLDLRRIDIMIGEKDRWGRGYGNEAIRLLVRFGFEQERADALFACGVADYNPRSHHTFARAGFVNRAVYDTPDSPKSRREYDLVLTQEGYRAIDQRVQ